MKSSDREWQVPFDITYIWNLINNTNESIYKNRNETHRHRKQNWQLKRGKDVEAE